MWNLGNTSGRHVALYVEDEPINVMLMQALFERRPQWELVIATTGDEARRLPADLVPDLLMLDLRLPDCHGTELLPELRRRPGWHIPPAVAVTAEYGFQPDGTGFDEVWAKP
ncbi:MAG: response regulator, partial [Pseudomonadota bacterium]|nr:response regulator [Pseudomonadota bacterium]